MNIETNFRASWTCDGFACNFRCDVTGSSVFEVVVAKFFKTFTN
jgi:hypothetical protein